jgi:hypothetical protein
MTVLNQEYSEMTKPNSRRSGKRASDFSRSVILRSESNAEFAKLLEELNQEIQPEGFTERMYVEDFAYHVSEIKHLRCVKAGIIKNAWQTALANILGKILLPPARAAHLDNILAPRVLAYGWFVDEETRRRVSSLLDEAGLDWSAIEAEAYSLMLGELERVDRILTAREARRDKDLLLIAAHKESLARKIRQSSERVLSKDSAPSIATVLVED